MKSARGWAGLPAGGGGTFVSTVPISPKGRIDNGAQAGSNTVTIVSVKKTPSI